MLDLLAAISSVDPPSLLAWLVFLFAAGMYPVGIMLGSSCSPCCGQPCTACTEGELPDTITVTIDGYQDEQVQGPDLSFLTFNSNFGSGAAGKVTAPGETPGPIGGVEITSGGEGYARFARVQPTVTASALGGTGATFSVSLNQIEYEGRPAWEVSSLTPTNGGTGYPASGVILFGVNTGGTAVESAQAAFYCGRTQPTVTASVSGSAGSGAVLTPTLTQGMSWWDGRPIWQVDSVTIDNGGSGYSEWDYVVFSSPDGDGYGYGVIGSVDENGAITSVYAYYTEFYKSNGVIESVELGYYGYGGKGIYYFDDPTATPEKSTVTVGVTQLGSSGTGATFTVTIDDNTSSATFGQITAVNITNGGGGYLAWKYRSPVCCADYWNGLSVVLKRSKEAPCLYTHAVCGTSCGADISVLYRGPSQPPLVTVNTNQNANASCRRELTSTTLVTDCSAMSFEAKDSTDVTATVSAGGEYDATSKADNGSGRCFSCCRGDSDPPAEIEVEVAERYIFQQQLAGGGVETVDTSWICPIYAACPPDSLPVVVLRKTSPCDGIWYGTIPSSLSGATQTYKVAVEITPCEQPLEANCDHCWKKCQTRAWAATFWAVAGGSNQENGRSDPCVSCISSPTCAPVSGTYLITKGYGNSWTPWAVRVVVQ